MGKLLYDTVIVGSGPAGLTAGIYTCRGQLKTLLIECFSPPSQAVVTDLIENYPGFPEGIDGFGLIERFKNQAKNFDLEFQTGKVERILPQDKPGSPAAQGLGKKGNIWQVNLQDKAYHSLTVILAVGTRPRQLGVPGEEKFRGKGVSYCAICDGAFFKDKDIVVVGGGDSAVSEALFLTRFARRVFLVHRRSRLRAVSLLAQKVRENERIEFIGDSIVTQIYGKDKVEGVNLKNLLDQKQSHIACSGVFVSVGYIPNTDFLADLVKLDSSGYIISDEAMQTSCPGIFACGDCRAKSLRQVVTACSDGAVAGFGAIEYVDRVKGNAYDG